MINMNYNKDNIRNVKLEDFGIHIFTDEELYNMSSNQELSNVGRWRESISQIRVKTGTKDEFNTYLSTNEHSFFVSVEDGKKFECITGMCRMDRILCYILGMGYDFDGFVYVTGEDSEDNYDTFLSHKDIDNEHLDFWFTHDISDVSFEDAIFGEGNIYRVTSESMSNFDAIVIGVNECDAI